VVVGVLLLVFPISVPPASPPAGGVSPAIATALSASVSSNITYGQIPLTVGFFSNVSGGTPPYTYDWNFADGCTCRYAQNATHTFVKLGTFMVRFTATDHANSSVRRWINITVTSSTASAWNLGLNELDWATGLVLGIASGLVVGVILGKRQSRR
jgi:PKD repeat protein